MDRKEALALVEEYTNNKNLVKHMLAVEAAMRFYAKLYLEDEEKWGICGLVHDFDYEKMGNAHPSAWGFEVLRARGVDELTIQAIIGHAKREDPSSRPTLMAKTLFAVDELCGFIVAVALMKPGQLTETTISSVLKKLKDKAFARGVSREDIMQGIIELDITLEDHVSNVLSSMMSIREDLGLR